MNIIRFVRAVITHRSSSEKIKREHEAKAKLAAETIAKHDMFWLCEYPMRMAEVSAQMTLMKARSDKMKADAQLKAAEENAAWQAKLCAIHKKANTSIQST